MAILISGKVDCKAKRIISGKDGHYKMMKGPIHKEDIVILNVETTEFQNIRNRN